ncbi:dead end protein 1 [Cololabis saira]|uniref:dead end protein 1 n=1 Tax=Cololabis saira TaxID=129043 RepID=UPI002AD3D49E|nr:dead end protein 1 [Cololabis saira]
MNGGQGRTQTEAGSGPGVGKGPGGAGAQLSLITPPEKPAQKLQKVLNLERVEALDVWLKATNTKVTQVNGQRKYGGPPEAWDGPTPGVRCEVFISQIPRDAYEDLLIPLFSSVGPLWEFRLMMNFSGQNRGFAYAKYATAAVATDAIRLLHGHMLEPGLHLCVRRSTEKRHVCIGDLPASTKQGDLLQVLQVLVEGVDRLSLKAGPGIEGVTAIVAFTSHHAASMAKKVLVEEFKKLFFLNVSIKWHSEKLPQDEPRPQKAPRLQPLSSPSPSPQSQHSLPPPPGPFPSARPLFCRAVGGPIAPQQARPARPASPSPVLLLRRMCEATGLGQPLYEIRYSHPGSDGFMHFNYKVLIRGAGPPFKGWVAVLPEPSAGSMMDEAEKAAAQQVLYKIYSQQLAD